MSIKDKLRAAILSGGAKAAMPVSSNGKVIDLQIADNATTHFVAPYDGYITVAAGTNAQSRIRISSSTCEASAGRNSSGNAAAAFLPISKGCGYDVQMISVGTVYFARFVTLVGGGLKALWHSLFGGLCHA